MNTQDTIAAIATAPGEAGISIVRISGPESLAIADRIFRSSGPRPSKRPTRSLLIGQVVHDDIVLDQALLLVMRAPHSYTCEDVVEIHGHGGTSCARRILRAVLESGARSAEPGEFTQRAFLNGRIDLVQAEAVLDLIRARSDRAASAAVDQLEGRLSDQFNQLYDEIIHLAADIESTLDFPEDELPEQVMTELRQRCDDMESHVQTLISTWNEGRLLREGALVVISGKPNVGKSTLLNALLGMDRAIVSDEPGTTRDTIEEELICGGIPIRLMDTAGLRETASVVEKMGIERTQASMAKADIHLYMVDASVALTLEEDASIKRLPKNRSLVILNKIDLGDRVGSFPTDDVLSIKISTRNDQDITRVKEGLTELLSRNLDLVSQPHATISERHRNLLQIVLEEVRTSNLLLRTEEEGSIPLVSAHLRSALEELGKITGRIYHEELLNSIFSRFCIGK